MSFTRRTIRIASFVLSPLILLASFMIATGPGNVGASSHREAPLISKDPSADNTDVYAFVSPDAPTTVTLIANWIPFEEPGGGPNFYHFDDNARYNIKIDRDGDGKPEITYEWRFKTVIKNPNTFLYNNGPITSPTSATYNYTQVYTVTAILGDSDGGGTRTVLFGNKTMVPDNIGPRSTPNYDALAAQFINTSTVGSATYKEFTGQRQDPFYVDVNSIFDLGGLRPFNGLHLVPLTPTPGLDSTAGYNIHTTAIQVPISRLAPDCPANDPGVGGSTKCVIGVWSTADRPRVTTRGGILGVTGEAGSPDFIQVSRLGMPLTNEVVLPLALKDAFNGLKPEQDTPLFAGTLVDAATGTLAVNSVTRPELQQLLPILYPGVFKQTGSDANLPALPRTDLLTIFLTGIPGVNAQEKSGNPLDPATASKIASDQLRLNVAIKPTAAVCQGKRMGAIDGDFAGFPNGRRLEDDVTDIALRAVAGGYGSTLQGALAPLGISLPNFAPGNVLGDGVDKDDKPCLSSFPYVSSPHSGYNRVHAAITSQFVPFTPNTAATTRGR